MYRPCGEGSHRGTGTRSRTTASLRVIQLNRISYASSSCAQHLYKITSCLRCRHRLCYQQVLAPFCENGLEASTGTSSASAAC